MDKVDSDVYGRDFVAYVDALRGAWDSTVDDRMESVRAALSELLLRSYNAPWVALVDGKPGVELYRDSDLGFIQMAHTHAPERRNAPHDHGRAWVVYGVLSGCIEISEYERSEGGEKDQIRRKASEVLEHGKARIYRPGVIHSTLNVNEGPSVVLRFLSEDLDRLERSYFDWASVVR